LIPKADVGEYRGIALLEIIYNLILLIINGRLIGAVNFDDSMHSNLPRRGTSTAITEAKLLAQLRGRIDEPLFMVFVDLKKASYSLDRAQAMRILAGYGVGVNIRRIINLIWQGDTMVPRQAGYLGSLSRRREAFGWVTRCHLPFSILWLTQSFAIGMSSWTTTGNRSFRSQLLPSSDYSSQFYQEVME